MDAFTLDSQQKDAAAISSGKFRDEIVPVEIPQRKGETLLFDRDEYPRPDTDAGALAKLRPAFQSGGRVTAGKASGINDGAAVLAVILELGMNP